MSEFTEAYYFASSAQGDGAASLAGAGLSGWVFPPAQRWVTVVPDVAFRGTPSDELVRSRGVTAYFVHAEDHGWGLSVWLDGSLFWEYHCNWERELDIDEGYRSRHLVEVLAKHGVAVDAVAFDDALHPLSIDDVVTKRPAQAAAHALRLPHYEWLQAAYLTDNDDRAALAQYVEHGSGEPQARLDLDDLELKTRSEMTPSDFPLPSNTTYFSSSSGALTSLALGFDGDLADGVETMATALEEDGYTVARGLHALHPRVLAAIAAECGLEPAEKLARRSEAGERWLAWAKADDLGAVSFTKTLPQRHVPPVVLSVFWLKSPR